MNNKQFYKKIILIMIFLLCVGSVFAQTNTEEVRLNTIKYGTDTEIANLIQALKNEGADCLDN